MTASTKAAGARKPGTTTHRSDTAQIREGVTKARHGTAGYVRHHAERAVDVPVGAAIVARERVEDVVEPWIAPEKREKELKELRVQVTRELNKFERRGGQARRKATQRARHTRTRFERELKQRRRAVEKAVKENRTRIRKSVTENRGKVEDGLRKAQTEVSERVSTLV